MNHTAVAIDFAELVRDVVTDQAEWSQATFGSDAERGPIGALKHLSKEALEAVEAAEKLSECAGGVDTKAARAAFYVELADCLLLLLDASRRAGLKPMQLFEVAKEKMAENRLRTWPKPTSDDEPVEHVKE